MVRPSVCTSFDSSSNLEIHHNLSLRLFVLPCLAREYDSLNLVICYILPPSHTSDLFDYFTQIKKNV